MNPHQVLKDVLGAEPAITPEDMCAKRFPTRLTGGYRQRDVDEYLRRSADLLETLLNRIHKLTIENQEQKRELADFRQHEQSLHEALVSAQRVAQDTLETARSKAETMVAEARLQREQLLLEAKQLPASLATEVRRLTEQRDRLREELTGILETHARLLRRRPAATPVKQPPEEPFGPVPRPVHEQGPFSNEEDEQE